MSADMRSAESSPRWKRVGAAGTKPEESAVEPEGVASRSRTSTSCPASFAASARRQAAGAGADDDDRDLQAVGRCR